MDPIERWLSFYDSEDSRNRHRNALERFSKCVGVAPEVLLERTREQIRLGPPQDAEDALMKFYHDMRDRGLARSSRQQWVTVIRGFFSKNGVRLPPLSQLKSSSQPPATYEHTESVPFSQKDVKRMIKLTTASKLGLPIARRNKAVIAFLAQTGQRESVLAGITWEMIQTGKRIALRCRDRSHAVIGIGPEFPKNKLGQRYRFVIGSNTMKLIERLPRPHVGRVFKISVRTIGRIVDTAADACKIQYETERKFRGWMWHTVHPHVFRRYWKSQMKAGGAKDEMLLEYMLSHSVSAYDAWTDDVLLRNYRMAERKLAVL